MKFYRAFACLGFYCGVASALTPQDFTTGMGVDGDAEYPVWELEVPDAVYAGVRSAGLADLRVFNAQQLAVPHAICRQQGETTVRTRGREFDLPVFPLRSSSAGSTDGDVEVDVDAPAGTDVRVEVDSIPPALTPDVVVSGYVIDASKVGVPITALRLRWATADGASEIGVRVEESDTLDQWRVVVSSTKLVRLANAQATLERSRIPLATSARYRYLRLVRIDDGPPPVVEAVIAETEQPVKSRSVPLRWFSAQPGGGDAEAGFDYSVSHRAPVETARIALPVRNQLVALKLQSRVSAQSAWTTRWQGPWSNFAPDGAAAVMLFAPTADLQWRIQITDGADAFGGVAPTLDLGYTPERLRFVAQGGGPYTLAYGSGRAKPAEPRDCEWWRSTVSPGVGMMLGQAQAGPPQVLGGDAALQPLAEPPPVQRYVLWGVLVGGTLLLLAMAFSLLRRLRSD